MPGLSAHRARAARLDAARDRPGQQFTGKAALAKGAPTDEVMIVGKTPLQRVVAAEEIVNLLSSLGIGLHSKRVRDITGAKVGRGKFKAALIGVDFFAPAEIVKVADCPIPRR